MSNPDKCPKCGSSLWVPIRNGHANYECNSFMTSDGKFGQDITCARLEKIAGPMLARLEKLQAALKRIRDCDWPGPLPLVPSRADWMQQIAKEALE